MNIKLQPQIRSDFIKVFKYQDTLVINDIWYDFSELSEGDSLPSEAVDCSYITGNVTRTNGMICLEMILPLSLEEPYEKRFPIPLLEVADGFVLEAGIQNAN